MESKPYSELIFRLGRTGSFTILSGSLGELVSLVMCRGPSVGTTLPLPLPVTMTLSLIVRINPIRDLSEGRWTILIISKCPFGFVKDDSRSKIRSRGTTLGHYRRPSRFGAWYEVVDRVGMLGDHMVQFLLRFQRWTTSIDHLQHDALGRGMQGWWGHMEKNLGPTPVSTRS